MIVCGRLNKKKGVFRKTALYACVTEETPYYLWIQIDKDPKNTSGSAPPTEGKESLLGWERHDLRLFNVVASENNDIKFYLNCKHAETCHNTDKTKHSVGLYGNDSQLRNFWVAQLNSIQENF